MGSLQVYLSIAGAAGESVSPAIGAGRAWVLNPTLAVVAGLARNLQAVGGVEWIPELLLPCVGPAEDPVEAVVHELRRGAASGAVDGGVATPELRAGC